MSRSSGTCETIKKKKSKLCVIGVPEGEKNESVAEKVLEGTVV